MKRDRTAHYVFSRIQYARSYFLSNEQIFEELMHSSQSNIHSTINHAQKILEENPSAKDDDTLIETFAENIAITEEASDYLYRILTVGLYSEIELEIKRIINWILGVKRKKAFSMFSIRSWIEVFAKRGIDLTQLDGYRDFDLLRLVNNSFKHNGGYPSAELISKMIPPPPKNKVIKIEYNDIQRYQESSKIFINSLYSSILTKIHELVDNILNDGDLQPKEKEIRISAAMKDFFFNPFPE